VLVGVETCGVVERHGAEEDDACDGGKTGIRTRTLIRRQAGKLPMGLRQTISCIARPSSTCCGAAPLRFVLPAAVVAQSVDQSDNADQPRPPSIRNGEGSVWPSQIQILSHLLFATHLVGGRQGRPPPRGSTRSLERPLSSEEAERGVTAGRRRWPSVQPPQRPLPVGAAAIGGRRDGGLPAALGDLSTGGAVPVDACALWDRKIFSLTATLTERHRCCWYPTW